MKQKAITSVIKQRFSTIQEYTRKMLIDFNEEAVHDFRTEIKKLRAFLRLMNTAGNKPRFSISKKLKVYYWYAGNIRNLQLHITSIEEMGVNNPAEYLHNVKKQVESLQGALRALHSPSNFESPKNMIRNWVAEPGKPLIKKFVHQKKDAFNHLLTKMEPDEILHDIRKLLKDLLYNWKYIKEYASLLPVAISTKKQISELTDVLGEFCDRITRIHLLETYKLANNDPVEGEILLEIISKWNKEKDELRCKVYSMLNYSPA